jgi:secreted protein with Ig-like and vWFA domain
MVPTLVGTSWELGIGGSKSVTVSTGSSRQSGGASNQKLSTSAIVRAASTNGDRLRASPVSLPTTSPGGNDEANSPAAWTARSGESSSGEGTAGVSIGTKKETETERWRGISPARGAPESVGEPDRDGEEERSELAIHSE